MIIPRNNFAIGGFFFDETPSTLHPSHRIMKNKLWITTGILVGTCTFAPAQDTPIRPLHTGPPPHAHGKFDKKFDKDGDGRLSKEERKAMHEAHRKELLEKFDKDGDGKLSDDELKAAQDARMAERENRRRAMLQKFDKDGDGKLSEEERAAMPKPPPAAQEPVLPGRRKQMGPSAGLQPSPGKA
jgi:hypothetical protein